MSVAKEAGQPGERVVLLDEDGNAIGVADKKRVHSARTPLHLAFSCYVFDSAGSLLVTRRAEHKATWPGVWSNSLCGHPGPGEDLVGAVHRRARQELGVRLRDVRLILPGFRYHAQMADGIRENEICPVLTAVTDGPARPAPQEVAECAWVNWPDFRDDVLHGRREVSPWCAEQVAELASRENPPGRWAAADPAELPPAAPSLTARAGANSRLLGRAHPRRP